MHNIYGMHTNCLSHCSVAVRRYHDQGTYKKVVSFWPCLQLQSESMTMIVRSIDIPLEKQLYRFAGWTQKLRAGGERETETDTEIGSAWAFETSKPFHPQCHTSSDRVIPLKPSQNSSKNQRPSIQIYGPIGAILIQTMGQVNSKNE